MLQYKIPQEVGIADKIVGPFSLRQLIIVAIGVGISYVLFAITSKLYELNILEYIIIALPALIAIAAAMVKINNIPLPKFTLLALEFAIKPKKRMWDHRGISAIVAPDLSEKKSVTEKAVTEEKGRNDVNLEDLSRVLDSGGFEHVEEVKHEGIDQAADDDLMVEAFFGHKEGTGENMWARSAKDRAAYDRKLKLLSELPRTEVKALKEVKEQIELIKKEESKPVPPAPMITETKPKESPIKTEIAPPKQPVAPKTDKIEQVKPAPREAGPREAGPREERAPREAGPREAGPREAGPREAGPREERAVTPFKKKKRRRKKKPKFAKPIRPETQINTTQKKQPVKLIEKQPQNKQPAPKDEQPLTQAKEDKGGEIHLEELQRGEIELNLD